MIWPAYGQPPFVVAPITKLWAATLSWAEDIGTRQADGVTFTAIKGLIEELNERDKGMAERDKPIEATQSEEWRSG